MHLIHESTTRYSDGLIDVNIIVVLEPASFKKYTYRLSSEYIVDLFQKYLKRGRGMHRAALALLNHHKVLMIHGDPLEDKVERRAWK